MHVHIEANDDAGRERAIRLLQYALDGYRESIVSLHLTIGHVDDPLGRRLCRCHVCTHPRRGPTFDVDEVQSSLDLAVTRAIERSLRRIRRQAQRAPPASVY